MSIITLAIISQLCTGIAYFNAGKYDDALAQFDYMVVRNQDSKFCEDALYYSVLSSGAKEDKQGAEAYLKKLSDRYPKSEYIDSAKQAVNEIKPKTSP
jgi:TolA-binding protein